MENLKNKKVAILATNGFEESELMSPQKAFREAGATVHIVSPESGSIRGWKNGNWSEEVKVDRMLDNVKADYYNALMLPGGVINPDTLRQNDKAITFIRDFFKQSKPVGAICHAPSLLAEADVLKGRKVTSYKSIETDLRNAGAHWVDEECVCDEALVTARTPNDLDAFNNKFIEEVAEGKHEMQMA